MIQRKAPAFPGRHFFFQTETFIYIFIYLVAYLFLKRVLSQYSTSKSYSKTALGGRRLNMTPESKRQNSRSQKITLPAQVLGFDM